MRINKGGGREEGSDKEIGMFKLEIPGNLKKKWIIYNTFFLSTLNLLSCINNTKSIFCKLAHKTILLALLMKLKKMNANFWYAKLWILASLLQTAVCYTALIHMCSFCHLRGRKCKISRIFKISFITLKAMNSSTINIIMHIIIY